MLWSSRNKLGNIKSCFLGLAIGDALGVPLEFRDREFLRAHPVKTMTGYGAWNQPPGTWSDDSSLVFCLAESLSLEYDVNDIANKSVQWMRDGYWGAHHEVFDIGNTTKIALTRVQKGESPFRSGETDETSNGNGSLMRIVPASLYFYWAHEQMLMTRMKEISGITHGHFRSVFSCFLYSKLVAHILSGKEKNLAVAEAMEEVNAYISQTPVDAGELKHFNRILDCTIVNASENEIQSTGYVIHTLEAAIWCFLNTDSYTESVLKAVNLGGDSDTTACVTGALTGLYYGEAEIPEEWVNTIARKADIISLSDRFGAAVNKFSSR